MANKRVYPPEMRANIVDRYKRGQSAKDIGFALSVGEGTVLQILKEEGVKIRTKGRTWRGLNAQDVHAAAQRRARTA